MILVYLVARLAQYFPVGVSGGGTRFLNNTFERGFGSPKSETSGSFKSTAASDSAAPAVPPISSPDIGTVKTTPSLEVRAIEPTMYTDGQELNFLSLQPTNPQSPIEWVTDVGPSSSAPNLSLHTLSSPSSVPDTMSSLPARSRKDSIHSRTSLTQYNMDPPSPHTPRSLASERLSMRSTPSLKVALPTPKLGLVDPPLVEANSPLSPVEEPSKYSGKSRAIEIDEPTITSDYPPPRVVPPVFRPLVDQLDNLRSKSATSPFRLPVSKLFGGDTAYEQAGVRMFDQYFALAEEAGIVNCGGMEADRWVALNPKWYGYGEPVPVSPHYTPKQHYAHVTITSSFFPPEEPTPSPTCVAPTSGTAKPPFGSSVLAGLAKSPPIGPARVPVASSNSPPPSKPVNKTPPALPPTFRILAEQLEQARLKGNPQVEWSTIGSQLLSRSSSVYTAAGVTRLKQYAALAEEAGVILTGGHGNQQWVSLHPKWHGKVLNVSP